ncbi:MAG: hypothetical protein ACXVXP_11990, partial [Mycobacteriaceae bacterium]
MLSLVHATWSMNGGAATAVAAGAVLECAVLERAVVDGVSDGAGEGAGTCCAHPAALRATAKQPKARRSITWESLRPERERNGHSGRALKS